MRSVNQTTTAVYFTGATEPADDETSEQDDHEPFDPERITSCAYWRCGELFERKTSNQIYCRKACRSRQNKWQRAQDRRARRGR